MRDVGRFPILKPERLRVERDQTAAGFCDKRQSLGPVVFDRRHIVDVEVNDEIGRHVISP